MRGKKASGFFGQWRRRAKEACWPALVVASIVHVLSGVYAELDTLTNAIGEKQAYRYVAPHATLDRRSHLAVAVIDEATFETRYGGTTPIDRCALADDLEPILVNDKILMVGIDYFVERKPARMSDPLPCQERLEALLSKYAHKVIAISRQPALLAATMRDVQPASSVVERSHLGYVQWHTIDELQTLGSKVALAMCRQAPPGDNTLRAPPPYCEQVHRDDDRWFAGDFEPANRRSWITFRHLKTLFRNGQSIPLNDPCLRHTDCGVRYVLVGGAYGAQDLYRTFVGERYGVSIHAAIASQPRIHRAHWQEMVVDVALGALIFGPLVSWTWEGYFLQKLGRARARTAWLRAAPLAHVRLAIGALLLLAVLAVCLFAASFLYLLHDLWISPAPIAVGMVAESMVVGSVHSAHHLLEDDHAAPKPVSSRASALNAAQRVVAGWPRVAAIALVCWAVIPAVVSAFIH